MKLRILFVLAGLAVALAAPGLARADDDPAVTPTTSAVTGMADGNSGATDGMADGNGGAVLDATTGMSDGNGGADLGEPTTAPPDDGSTAVQAGTAITPVPVESFGMSDGNG